MKVVSMRAIAPAVFFLVTFASTATHVFAQGGVPLWTNRYNDSSLTFASPQAIVADDRGYVFVTGWSGNNPYHFSTVAYSDSGVPVWTNYEGVSFRSGAMAEPAAMAIDNNGNIFVAGYITDGVIFSSYDYLTAAYSVAGTRLWTNRYNPFGGSSNFPSAVVIDNGGNLVVAGASTASGSGYDYTLMKYSSAGSRLWTRSYNGFANGNDIAKAVTTDANGNVYVTGYSLGIGSSNDFVTLCYSSSGSPIWTNFYDGPANSDDRAVAIAIDKAGNTFVTGQSLGVGSGYDYATVAYSDTGVPLWTNRYNGPGNGDDFPRAIAVDAAGNVFVTGYSRGGTTSNDYATVAYSGAGVPLWTNRFNGPANNDDRAVAISVDRAGNVFVTGYSMGIGSSYDYATVAYSGAGVRLWTNRFDGAGPANNNDYATAMTVDIFGNVFVTGYSWRSGGHDFATIKYSSSLPIPYLDFQRIENQLILMWTNADCTLQAAPAVDDAFTNVFGAVSPFTNSVADPQMFYRLLRN
jgi:3-isopropylmalate dehydratase small subunit